MKYLLLNGSIVGHKTRNVFDELNLQLQKQMSESDSIKLIDLKDKKIAFSDGRNWQDNSGDTLEVLADIMEAEVLVLGVPTYQASIPAPLKNIFDLLPEGAFYHKTVAFIVTAGSQKHYLVMEYQLKPILNFMKANVLTNYVFADDSDFNGSELSSDDISMRLVRYAEDIKITAESYKKQLDIQDALYDF